MTRGAVELLSSDLECVPLSKRMTQLFEKNLSGKEISRSGIKTPRYTDGLIVEIPLLQIDQGGGAGTNLHFLITQI